MSRRDAYDDERVVVVEERGGNVGMLLLGLAIGAGAALLFAPASGVETRARIEREARRAGRRVKEMTDDVTGEIVDRYGRTKAGFDERVARARNAMRARRRAMSEAVEAGREGASEARADLERAVADTKRAYAESRRAYREARRNAVHNHAPPREESLGAGQDPLTALREKADGWWDIVRRVWKQGAEDNVFFLAGGLAFNVLLALLPFVLLLVSGMALLLGAQPDQAARTVTGLLQAFLPDNAPSAIDLLSSVIEDVQRTRGAVTLYAAIGFAWFSTRLFGSLRSVLAQIFDGTDRGIVVGKLFDFSATLVATMAVVVYIAISAYLDLATTRGVELLVRMGLRESSMGTVTYIIGRLLAILIVFGFFYTLYHGLPRRRPSARTALTAAGAAALMFEIARSVFTVLVRQFDPSSLYTGTIAVVVAVVFWTYYGALLFILGGELAQAVELRRLELEALERRFTAERERLTPKTTGTMRTPKRGSR